MHRARPSRRRFVPPLWLAVLALAFQALAFGVSGHAKASPSSLTVEVCGSHGTRTVTLELPAPPADSQPCRHCPDCTAAIAAIEPQAALSVGSAAFVRIELALAPASLSPPASYRALPPSQGPPEA